MTCDIPNFIGIISKNNFDLLKDIMSNRYNDSLELYYLLKNQIDNIRIIYGVEYDDTILTINIEFIDNDNINSFKKELSKYRHNIECNDIDNNTISLNIYW